MTVIVELYQEDNGVIHYEFRERGVPRSRRSVCGLDTRDLRHAAFFAVGDKRGKVHYDKAHDACRAALVV